MILTKNQYSTSDIPELIDSSEDLNERSGPSKSSEVVVNVPMEPKMIFQEQFGVDTIKSVPGQMSLLDLSTLDHRSQSSDTVEEIVMNKELPTDRKLASPNGRLRGYETGKLPETDSITLQMFLTKTEDEYDLFKLQVIMPLINQIKVRKPYMRTRDSRYDED